MLLSNIIPIFVPDETIKIKIMRFDYRRELKSLTVEQLKSRVDSLKDRLLNAVDSKAYDRYLRYLGYAETELNKR